MATVLVAPRFVASPSPKTRRSIRRAERELIGGTRQLTFEGKRAGEGYFSQDGKWLVFQSERDADNPFYQIFLMNLENGDVERISPGHGKTTCGWLHPDNSKVLFASTHEDEAARDKQKEELDFRASGKERRYAWDYDETFELFAYDRTTKTYEQLTDVRGYDAEASYSPDGSKIAFASNRSAYESAASSAEELTKNSVRYLNSTKRPQPRSTSATPTARM